MKETIINIIAEYLDKDPADISATATFSEIGLDSLDIMELVMKIEDETNSKIELTQEINTVEKLVAYIEENK